MGQVVVNGITVVPSTEQFNPVAAEAAVDGSAEKFLALLTHPGVTLGRNAVGYLTESLHGAGSPQAQRIQIARGMQLEFKQQLAKRLAQIEDT